MRAAAPASRPLVLSHLTRARRPFSTSSLRNAEGKDIEFRSLSLNDNVRLPLGEEEVPEFTAAPEIDLNTTGEDPEMYNHELPLLSRIRIVPDSPSYFSGQPEATDEFLFIQSLYLKYLGLPRVESYNATGETTSSDTSGKEKVKGNAIRWIKFVDFQARPGRSVKRNRYDDIIKMLNSLAAIEPVLMPSSVSGLIQRFRVVHPHEGRVKWKPSVDEWGRGVGVGNRKSASAKVFLVKGDGQVLINGRSLAEAFPRLHDRESALWPLKVTNRIDTYNVWALARGGGSTGQAEAVTLGLAKALLVHEPDLFRRLFDGKSTRCLDHSY
jgi:small subunit ribosomal protein S9